MKTITVNVSEPVYREFQEYAKRKDRKTAELIREAMEQYRERTIAGSQSQSLRQLNTVPAGKVLRPLAAGDDLLGEMLNGD
jgi:predicted transcriptional regulator